MISRRTLVGLGLVAGASAAAAGALGLSFQRAISEASARIARQKSALVATRFGSLEYAEAGIGPPVLMIHGTGGGFDQGLRFSRRLVTAGYRVIAPSRFGYLRSAMPREPSSENQADAFVDLIDELRISKIPVIGGSAGALSALQFAIRHPARCAALITIVPAAFAPNRPPARPWTPLQASVAERVLKSDFLFWCGLHVAEDTMIETLLATDIGLVRAAPKEEQERVQEILWSILPVSERAEGLLNDARLAGNPAPVELDGIRAPTLTISLEDDRFLTADAARHIANSVTGARLVIYPSGGHVWVGRDSDVFEEITQFLNGLG